MRKYNYIPNPGAVALGKLGGRRTAERHSKDHYRELGRKSGVSKRRMKLEKVEGIKLDDTTPELEVKFAENNEQLFSEELKQLQP